MLALAAMWAYDLHLYTVAYLTRAPAEDLFALRGVVLAAAGAAVRARRRRNARLADAALARGDLPVALAAS